MKGWVADPWTVDSGDGDTGIGSLPEPGDHLPAVRGWRPGSLRIASQQSGDCLPEPVMVYMSP